VKSSGSAETDQRTIVVVETQYRTAITRFLHSAEMAVSDQLFETFRIINAAACAIGKGNIEYGKRSYEFSRLLPRMLGKRYPKNATYVELYKCSDLPTTQVGGSGMPRDAG
jgi:hypothetical protein